MYKKEKSGAQKRKEKEEEEKRIAKLPKISKFFSSKKTGQDQDAQQMELGVVDVVVEPLLRLQQQGQGGGDDDLPLPEQDEEGEGVIEVPQPQGVEGNFPGQGADHADAHKGDAAGADRDVHDGHDPDLLTQVRKMKWPTDRANFYCGQEQEISVEIKKFILGWPKGCQPEGPFLDRGPARRFNASHYSVLSNSGIKIRRIWLQYSPTEHSAYCLFCWLFPQKSSTSSWTTGLTDFSHLAQSVQRHENSQSHISSCAASRLFMSTHNITSLMSAEEEKRFNFWQEAVTRVVEIILFLGCQNLPLRGHNERPPVPVARDDNDKLSSLELLEEREDLGNGNRGNFLELVAFKATRDEILNELLKKEPGTVKYLSATFQNEVIDAINQEILADILSDVREAPFYSLILDGTIDAGKVDQESFVIRYLKFMKDSVGNILDFKIEESFLGFYEAKSQKSADLQAQVLGQLESFDLSLKSLRGLGFDGAANMSGAYSGLQKRIRDVQPHASYVHCAAHALNLVLKDSVSNIPEMRNFYTWSEELYLFFSGSIIRWLLLKCGIKTSSSPDQGQVQAQEDQEGESSSQNLPSSTVAKSLKRLCVTRWSSRESSLLAIAENYQQAMIVLAYLSLKGKTPAERERASKLQKYFSRFETVLILVFETEKLKSTGVVTKALQSPKIDISKAKKLFDRAAASIKNQLNGFDVAKTKAEALAQSWGIATEFQPRRGRAPPRSLMDFFHNAHARSRGNCSEEHFKQQVYRKCLQATLRELESRSEGIAEIEQNFSFLLPKNLITSNEHEISQSADKLHDRYPDHFDVSLSTQLVQLKMNFTPELSKLNSAADLLRFIVVEENCLASSFPDVISALCLFLTLPVTVASAERSFSKLALIKTHLRTTMNQNRLSGLSLMSIERSRAKKIKIANILERLRKSKKRKYF